MKVLCLTKYGEDFDWSLGTVFDNETAAAAEAAKMNPYEIRIIPLDAILALPYRSGRFVFDDVPGDE